MLLYVLKLNQNAKMPEAYGKYYAYPVITQTVDIDGLAGHMASHNTPFSKGAIKGMITDMVSCIKELTLQGIAVNINFPHFVALVSDIFCIFAAQNINS